MDKELTEEEIVGILKEVKDPETSMSLFELGLVKYIDYQEEHKTLIVKCDFIKRNPTCVGCIPIAWMIQKKITDQLSERFMEFNNIKSIEFIP